MKSDPQYPGKYTYQKLRSRITEKFGFYCWETLHPMDFCIDDHVRYITNDPSACLTQDQVLREIQKFMDEPLPLDQPQWQILVVPKFLYNRDNDYFAHHDILEDDGFGNFDTITVKKPQKGANYFYGNNYYALVWRINHSLMDGISAANCLQHCISDMPAKLSIDPLQKIPVPFALNFVIYLNMFIFGSRSLLRSMLQRDLNCFHGPGLSGPKTLAWSRRINLDSVKTIRRRNETTMTAVLASSVGSALRGLAIRKNNPVPSEIRSGVTCALLKYPNIRPQRFTVAHLKLRLDPESSKDRLQFATKSAKRLVRSGDILKNYGLIRLIGLLPKTAIPFFMDNCEATVIISNIPGPTEEYTIFQGQKLVDVIGWNTIKGTTAIGVCIFSYAGRIRAGVIGDGAVLPSSSDVPSLVEELEKEIVQMAKDADIKEKDVFMQVY
ncbi:O-acyltransferase WSD [Orchesella cincta]|uniref:O-acyltransferase WSD n=1 Tax=Orchesella cincta TaxID=48709 RepID=A0A1D2MNN4_ORCCI|nr:O-acyltransferase WSD [Orchesella cincta]